MCNETILTSNLHFNNYIISPLILHTKSKSFGKIVTCFACTHVSIECSNKLTKYVFVASWSARIAFAWNLKPNLQFCAISRTRHENGHNGINNSHDFWYFLISHKACMVCLSLFNFLSSFCFSNFTWSWALVFLLAFWIILFDSLLGIGFQRVFPVFWVFSNTSCSLSFLVGTLFLLDILEVTWFLRAFSFCSFRYAFSLLKSLPFLCD